jgi:glc operon protein GlcG
VDRHGLGFEAGKHDLHLPGMTNLVPLDGGIPLVVESAVVGAIGVSWMRSDQDAQVAQAGVAAFDVASRLHAVAQ